MKNKLLKKEKKNHSPITTPMDRFHVCYNKTVCRDRYLASFCLAKLWIEGTNQRSILMAF